MSGGIALPIWFTCFDLLHASTGEEIDVLIHVSPSWSGRCR